VLRKVDYMTKENETEEDDKNYCRRELRHIIQVQNFDIAWLHLLAGLVIGIYTESGEQLMLHLMLQ
jgi:hypothetical protein